MFLSFFSLIIAIFAQTIFKKTNQTTLRMKRIYNFLALAIVAMLTLSLTSCEDERIADALDGIWEGQVSTNYSWRWSDYTKYQYVDMEFFKSANGYARGTGMEYDYDRWGGYTYCRFSYEVRNEEIFIDYEDGVSVRISRYTLTSGRFYGQFRDYRTGAYLADFDFVKRADHRYLRDEFYSKKSSFEEPEAE